MALKVGELFASLNLDTSGVGSAVSSAEAKMSSLGKGLAISGAAMTAAVTVPLKQAASAIYQSGSEFDAQMSKVFAIAGDSVTENTEAMEALRTKALEMGSTTQFTASQAGEAMEYMAMAGWKTEEMLSAVEPLMNLAAAAGADLGTTSDIVTDAMTAFGLSATDTVQVVKDGMEMNVNAVEYFADILAAASSNSNTNVTMLGESFKYAASLAGSLGYSANDVAIALGLMANTGIKSTMAGTSLSRVLQNMIKPSDETATAMEALGISMRDSKGQAKSLREIMLDFRSVAQKNGVDLAEMTKQVEELDAQFAAGKISEKDYEEKLEDLTHGSGDFLRQITQIAGARGLPGLLAIMNATDEDFDKLTLAIDNSTGAAAKMKAVMLDNVKGDVTLFNSALEGLEITLWKLGETGIRNIIQRGTELIDTFRTADPAIQSGTLRIAALAAAAGPVMAAMGGIVSLLPTLARTFTIVSGPAAMLAMGFVALGAAAIDSNNSIGKTFVKGITGAGKKLSQFGKNIKKQLPDLKKNMAVFLKSIRVGIEKGIPDIMNGLGDLLVTGLSALGSNMGNIAKISQTLVKTLADGLKQNMRSIVPAAVGLVTNLAAGLISNVPAILDAGVTLFTSLIDALGHINWAKVGTKIKTAITNALSEIRTNFYRLVFGEEPTEDDLGDWGTLGSKLVENIKKGIKKASNGGKNLLGGLVLGDDYAPDDSWGTVAGKIWGKITAKMGETLKNTSELLKGLILGDDYTADASWGKVARIIWRKIREEFKTLKANTKNLIGNIVLGADYDPGDTWKTIGSAIWEKAKAGFSGAYTTAKEIIGEFALGDDYDPGDSWKEIGSGIWGKIKTGLGNVGEKLKGIFTGIAFDSGEEGYQADASWADIGTKLWEKVQSGIMAGKEMATAILEKIGNVTIDVGSVVTAVENAGTFVTNLVDNMLKGKIEWGNKISNFAKRIGNQLAAFGWSNIGTTLGKVANNIIQALVNAIPNAIDAAGNAVDAGLTLAEGVLSAISSGFSTILSSDTSRGVFGGIVQKLVEGLVNAVDKLPELISGALSVGAQVANSIMGSIAVALTDTNASKTAGFLALAAKKLINGLLTSITNFGENPDVQEFMKNLGKGFSAAMSFLGDITGDLIAYILSPEFIVKVFDAGISIAKMLLSGVGYAIKGAADFIGGIVSSILDKLGIIDKDAMKNELNVGETLSDAIASSITDSSGEIRHNAESAFATILAAFAAGESDAFENMIEGTEIEDIYQQIMMAVFEHSNTSGFTGDKALLQQIFENAFASSDLDFGPILQKLPDNFWDIAYESITGNANKGEGKPLLDLLLESMLGDSISSSVEQSLQEKDAAIADAIESAGLTKTTKALETSLDEASKEATEAMQGTFVSGKEPVSEAAGEIGDEVVKKFLLTMSADNGKQIGTTWITAIQNGMGDVDITGYSSTLSTEVKDVVESILSESNGYTLGWNFAIGIANGINASLEWVAKAARTAAQVAIDAAKETLEVGSPSKRAEREIGMMYDRGLARGLLNGVQLVANAARKVSDTLHDQFYVEDMSHGTVYTARKTVQQTAEQTAIAAEGKSRIDPRAIGQAMAEYLLERGGGRIDIYLDKERVGGGVADPVSIAIAEIANTGRPEFV